MKAAAKEISAALGFVAVGVVVSLAVVLVQRAEAASGPRISWVWRGMSPSGALQCSDYEHDPDWKKYHIADWQSCWHLTETGYPAIDYTRTDGQTAGSGVLLDYAGDFELFKMEEYTWGYCTGARAEIYRGSYDQANYMGDIHYLHIDPNELWMGQEVPYQLIYIGDVLSEEHPNCLWTAPHLHQSASSATGAPFCSNKFENPSQGENWQLKVHWLPSYTNDTDCDRWTDNQEDIIGTDPEDDCGANAWPPDLQPNNCVNGADILKFIGRFAWMAPYNPRYDLKTNGRIDGADVLVMIPVMNTCCTP